MALGRSLGVSGVTMWASYVFVGIQELFGALIGVLRHFVGCYTGWSPFMALGRSLGVSEVI